MMRGAILMVALALLAVPAWAQEAEPEVETVITSKRFTYETAAQRALFEERVVVRDPRIEMKADTLWVHFGENEAVKRIKASGKEVIVQQADRSAGGKTLDYDIASGKLVLVGKAWVKQAGNTLRGDRITIWRDDQKIVAEPNVQFRVFLEGDAAQRTLSPMN